MRRWLGYTAADAAYRLVYAESDGLPGLIVDRYAAYLAVQLLTQGMAERAELSVQLLAELVQPRGIYERSDADVREKEGLPISEGLLWGEAPPNQIMTRQPGDLLFLADLRAGQKTGAYLDQAYNRLRVASYCAGLDVLDCFCYTGGFSVAAARNGARQVTAIDSSASALELLGANLALNDITAPVEPVRAMSSSCCGNIATRV